MSNINKIMEAYLGMVSERAIEEGVGDTAIAHQTPYGTVTATKRDTKGMKGKQDGYSLSLKTKSGKTVDLGSHPKPTKANVLSIVKNMMEETCPKCEGEGCDHCEGKGVHEKKLDPVNDKENDKKFDDRKDKDIDNDGDVDSSDEYLHKKRKATDDAIDGGKKPAKESAQVDEVSAELAKAAFKSRAQRINDLEKEKERETNKQGRSQIDKEIGSQDKKLARSHAKSGSDKPLNKSYDDAVKSKDDRSMTQKYNDYKKDGGKLPMDDWKKHQRESFDLDLSKSFADMWSAIEEAHDPKKGALAQEKYDDHSSDHDKKVIAQHKKSDKKVEDSVEDAIKKTFAAGGKSQKKAKEPGK